MDVPIESTGKQQQILMENCWKINSKNECYYKVFQRSPIKGVRPSQKMSEKGLMYLVLVRNLAHDKK